MKDSDVVSGVADERMRWTMRVLNPSQRAY